MATDQTTKFDADFPYWRDCIESLRGRGDVHAPELIETMATEIMDLRISVIAFGAAVAVGHAQAFGLPDGHLHATHYDILARAGARMDDFIRHEEISDGK